MPLGPIMLDLEGVELSQAEKKLLKDPLIGGVILFARNYQSPEQLQKLVFSIREVRSPIIIAVDQEGGRIQRFREGFTQLPPMSSIGEMFNQDANKAVTLAQATGWLMAIELLSLGVDISFAPVLDLQMGRSEVIGNRSLHSDPNVVSHLAKAYIQGMNTAGMQAVGKHFPGHGSVQADSHVEMPIDEREPEEILKADMIPFAHLAKHELAGMMTAHIIFNKLDPHPVAFSSFWLQQVLRKNLGFKGAIFSDDLSMVGAEVIGVYEERAKVALESGCDMILICNKRPEVIKVMETLQGYRDPLSEQRLLRMCGRFNMTRAELVNDPKYQQLTANVRLIP